MKTNLDQKIRHFFLRKICRPTRVCKNYQRLLLMALSTFPSICKQKCFRIIPVTKMPPTTQKSISFLAQHLHRPPRCSNNHSLLYLSGKLFDIQLKLCRKKILTEHVARLSVANALTPVFIKHFRDEFVLGNDYPHTHFLLSTHPSYRYT